MPKSKSFIVLVTLAACCMFLSSCSHTSSESTAVDQRFHELETRALQRQQIGESLPNPLEFGALQNWFEMNGDPNGLDLAIEHLGPSEITAQVHNIALASDGDPRFMIGSYGGLWAWETNPDQFTQH